MSKFLIASMAALMLAIGGCSHDDKDMDHHSSGSSMKASADVCPHCPGVQTANAEGKCPACGAKVK